VWILVDFIAMHMVTTSIIVKVYPLVCSHLAVEAAVLNRCTLYSIILVCGSLVSAAQASGVDS